MTTQLSKLVLLSTGVSFRRPVIDEPSERIRVIQLRDVQGQAIAIAGLARSDVKVNAIHAVNPGDIILKPRGFALAASIMPDTTETVVLAAPLIRVRITDTKLKPEFLAWFLNLPSTQRQLLAAAQGSVVPVVSLQTFASLPIVLPSHQKQDLIVDTVRLIKEEEELARRLTRNRIQLLESLGLD